MSAHSTSLTTQHFPNDPAPRCGSRFFAGNARLRHQAGSNSPREAVIATADATLGYVAEFLPEDEPLQTARGNAAEVGGAAPVGPVTGAALRFMAAAIGARAVVEIGTGCGASGIWLLRGMRDGSVLTSVDIEPDHQRLARAAFVTAGFGSGRYRLISGRALDVLPRLADGAYDLVFCDADRQEYPEYLAAALRLLRPGGVAVLNGVLTAGDPAGSDPDDDPEAAALLQVCEQVRSDEALAPLLLPVGGGLLAAVKLG